MNWIRECSAIGIRGLLVSLTVLLFCIPGYVQAATLRLSPDTGVYTAGSTFTASVLMNTNGKPVNAADAQLSFSPNELSVVSVTRASSIFNLWTLEPTFSNAAGTISFGGGSPSGYTGTSGNIITIVFKALGAGTPQVNFKNGSILAADGLGTNVLTAMTGGTYTVSAKTNLPPPEYVPPANTPAAPKVTSKTHPDESVWYRETTATVGWTIPSGITAVRTLLDRSPNTIPTKVYDDLITDRELTDLPQGTSYFHIQFKNADGWGRVTHFTLNVDSEEPSEFTIREESADTTNPTRTLIFDVKDISPILTFTIQLDGGEPIEFKDGEHKKQYVLESLKPGHHTVVVEAKDSAENSRIANYSFDVATFEPPVFTEYPERIASDVIPALRGTTRPDVDVVVTIKEGDHTYAEFTTHANAEGGFTGIPDRALPMGVYDITAIARDAHNRESGASQSIRIIVEEPGYMTIGTIAVRVLSVIVPLIALSILLIFGSWFLWFRLRRWKRKIMRETIDAEDKLKIEFDSIVTKLHANVSELKESRKGKLTKAETVLIEEMEQDIRGAQARIRKEIVDIEDVVE